jgi:hypothetical protein
VAGSGTSIASAYGTASSSDSAPPQWPPATPNPYIEIGGTLAQLPVCPARQAEQRPQLIWNGTTTRWPGRMRATRSPTETTSATHSCPKRSGSGNGVAPRASARSRSQVATAIGWTSAPSGPGGGGAGTARQASRPPGEATSARMRPRVGRSRSRAPSPAAAVSRRHLLVASRSRAMRAAATVRGVSSPATCRAQPRARRPPRSIKRSPCSPAGRRARGRPAGPPCRGGRRPAWRRTPRRRRPGRTPDPRSVAAGRRR